MHIHLLHNWMHRIRFEHACSRYDSGSSTHACKYASVQTKSNTVEPTQRMVELAKIHDQFPIRSFRSVRFHCYTHCSGMELNRAAYVHLCIPENDYITT